MTRNFRNALAVLTVAAIALFALRSNAQTVTSAGTFTQGADAAATVERGAVAVTFAGAQAPSAVTAADVTTHGQPVASAAPVYVNSPGPAVCANAGMGVSAQGAVAGGAISIGGSSNDECDAREGAKTAKFIGLPDSVAREMLCGVKTYRDAFRRAGTPCSADVKMASAPGALPPSTVAPTPAEPTDPIIRNRLGLPPL